MRRLHATKDTPTTTLPRAVRGVFEEEDSQEGGKAGRKNGANPTAERFFWVFNAAHCADWKTKNLPAFL